MNDDQNRRKDDQRPAVPLQWSERPNRWTLLLTGPTYGLVGESGKTWEGHDATYERVNVVELQKGTTVFPERDPNKPAAEQGLFNKFIVLRTDGTDAPGEKHHGCAYFVLDLDHDRHAPAAMRAYGAACSESHYALAADIVAKYGKPQLDDSEQYRCQMAGISTAALGYWKEADGVHPEYDTPALRDVARLYAKYDDLFQYRQMARDIPHLVRKYSAVEIKTDADLSTVEDFVKLSDVVALLGASPAPAAPAFDFRAHLARQAQAGAVLTVEHRNTLEQIAGFLHNSVNMVQNAPDEYGPASQFDYELGQAAGEIGAILASLAAPTLGSAPQADASAQAAQADARDAALEEAALAAEKVQDDYSERQGGKWPELRDDAATGAGDCAAEIRALKRPADDSQPAVGGAA